MENTDNRTRLLDCAKELFYAKGYDAVGVQEIVEKAGVTKPTLYYYFGSKKGLLEELISSKFEKQQMFYQKIRQEYADIRDALYHLADSFYEFFERDRKFYVLMMALFYSARENEAYKAIKPYISAFYETVVQVFEQSSGQLGNMRGRQRLFAIGFIGTINHYFLLHCEMDPEGQNRIDRNQINALVNQFMYGIFS